MSDEPTTAEPTPWWEMEHGEDREVAKYEFCWPDFDCDHDHDEGERILNERELNGLRERAEKAEAETGRLRKENGELRNLARDLKTELDEARAALAGWGEEWREHVYDHDLLGGGFNA